MQYRKNSCSQAISILDAISQKKTIQCKYRWSDDGDDGALIGDRYVIKLSGYTHGVVKYDEMAMKLGLATPKSKIINKSHSLWVEVEKALKDVRNHHGRFSLLETEEALIMTKVDGQPLSDISPNHQLKSRSLTNIFFEIGKMVVLDLYMRNYDRFDLSFVADDLYSPASNEEDEEWKPWDFNEGNLFINMKTGKAIPIDSNSYLDDIPIKKYRESVKNLLSDSEKVKKIIDNIIENDFMKKMIFSQKDKEIARKNVSDGIEFSKFSLFDFDKEEK